ncbi:hypothetical protein GCM10007933_30740 [Zoogloea oryzae]|jgi:hypothetical protein|uniref:DUF3135 domain-containing protein n=1 Tax=Zoogloea oryzae TaxID=310767 RepID=A0ABQ6FG64_9RHOO|nr:DUF3135 domain-containing protein [Zoogloea oryzae]GLT23607.1 hypothetical protein GCM10007933_30740 [Zoogloea oryzae]
MGDFDFDYWKDLAEQDPPGFFRAREQLLRQCIALHPQQAQELTEFQAHIDATRLLAGSPLQASRALFSLLEDQLMLLSARLGELHRETSGLRDLLASGQAA